MDVSTRAARAAKSKTSEARATPARDNRARERINAVKAIQSPIERKRSAATLLLQLNAEAQKHPARLLGDEEIEAVSTREVAAVRKSAKSK